MRERRKIPALTTVETTIDNFSCCGAKKRNITSTTHVPISVNRVVKNCVEVSTRTDVVVILIDYKRY